MGPHHVPKFWGKKPKAATKVTLRATKKDQGAADKNGDFNGTCEQGFILVIKIARSKSTHHKCLGH